MKRLVAFLIGVSLLLAVPGAALAASPTCTSYAPQTCTTINGHLPKGLPFTGLNVGLLLAGGAGLLAGGACLRRVSRTH